MTPRAIPALALLLASCATAPQSTPSASRVTPPDRLDAPMANVAQKTALDHWWTAWGDPALDRLVEKALDANADIRAAEARVRAARALVTVAESALYPTVAANGTIWASESDTDLDDKWKALLPPLSSGSSGSGHLVGLGASWEADIFGGRRADADAAHAAAETIARTADAVHLLVAADVVENYQQLQGLRRRLAILDDSIRAAERLRDYVAARFETGAATVADVTRVRNALEAFRASRPPLAALIDTRRRRLAVLTGDPPEQVTDMTAAPEFAVPPAPAGQLPSDILDRRPDVNARSSMVRMRAARLKSLRADLLPRFAIQFLGQNGHIGISGLPGFGGTGGLLGLSASAPIFTAGRLRARIAAGNAELEAAMADYDGTVLTALEEVEAAYGFRTGLDERLTGLDQALEQSDRRAGQMQAFYEAGRAQLGDVLQARIDALSDRDKREQARIARGTSAVQLYRALGGGW
jgi:NodT family efflux transporter outer membrane factor (OMF) lipoprotein